MENSIEPKFSIIIPCFNEHRTVRGVVKTALKTKGVGEVVVVNDGSTDGTRSKIEDLPIRIVDHAKNLGYTKAMHHGIKVAKYPIVAIIDADWQNVTPEAILKIVQPVLDGDADLVKASFNLTRGRVTEFAVRPMMSILFPETDFNQPISGQFAGHKSFLENIDADTSWGIAIGILIEAINAGLRVMEVDIGELVHKARTTEEKALMAKEVLETMIRKAGLIQHKYKLVVFLLEGVLVPQSSIKKVYEKLKIQDAILQIDKRFEKGKISLAEKSQEIAKLFVGKSQTQIDEICQKVPVGKYSSEVISALKRRKFKVGVVSQLPSPIVTAFAKRLGCDFCDCPCLEEKKYILTGAVNKTTFSRWSEAPISESLNKATTRIIHKAKVKHSQTVVVASGKDSVMMLKSAGLGAAYNTRDVEVIESAEKTIKVLAELLAIIE